MNFLFILFLVLFCKNSNPQDEGGILCSAKTCSDYINETPCSPLSADCTIQNSTNNGIFLPSPDPCNCCKYCLVNLNVGDYCAEGEDGGLIPDSICGPGLTCVEGICTKMTDQGDINSPDCIKKQADYDTRRQEGTLGFMEVRPNCDDDGFYLPYKCVPGQTCFCVDKEGNRIFGEIPYNINAHLIRRCECSRKYHEVLKFFDRKELYPNQHFRCTDNGDYDTIQCIGDNCMCTDTMDGAPTYPSKDAVNITEISDKTLGDCCKILNQYNCKVRDSCKNQEQLAELHVKFTSVNELTIANATLCAEKYINILEEIDSYKDAGYDTVFDIDFPHCSLDGKYAPVQKDERDPNGNYYCAYPNGTAIEGYNQNSKDNIDCKCARSSLLLSEDVLEKPECCANGNFNPVQCRRGKCYCVDLDGYQVVNNSVEQGQKSEVEVHEKYQLFCYDAKEQEECLATT